MGSLRRYLPVLIVLVLVASGIFVAAALSGGSDDDDNGSGGGGNASRQGSAPVLFSKARADEDWGPRCDTTLGRVKIPTRYAAPCVKPFDARTQENDGATGTGVTKDSIRVVVYLAAPDPIAEALINTAGADDDPDDVKQTWRDYLRIYEEVYETYGRSVDLVFFDGTGNDDTSARADAVKVAGDLGAFASINGPLQTSAYADELASRGVLCLGSCSGSGNDSFARANQPYIWPTGSVAQGSALQAEYIAKRVARRKAEHAGDPKLRKQTRRIGLVSYDNASGDYSESVQTFKDQLAVRHVKLAATASYQLDLGRTQETARTLIAKMKGADVTTVIFAGDPLTPSTLTREATEQDWFPEWLVTGGVLTDTNFFARQYDPRQWAHAFGAVGLPVGVPVDQTEPWQLHEWRFGTPPAARATFQLIQPVVWQLLTGIHLAGPRLDASTFRAGLFRFPPSGGHDTLPTISFGHHGIWPTVDLAGTDDQSEIWFDVNAKGIDEIGQQGSGMYRWANGGRRYLPGTWPRRASDAFRKEGAVTQLAKRPPGDQAPEYPPPVPAG